MANVLEMKMATRYNNKDKKNEFFSSKLPQFMKGKINYAL